MSLSHWLILLFLSAVCSQLFKDDFNFNEVNSFKIIAVKFYMGIIDYKLNVCNSAFSALVVLVEHR